MWLVYVVLNLVRFFPLFFSVPQLLAVEWKLEIIIFNVAVMQRNQSYATYKMWTGTSRLQHEEYGQIEKK